MAAMLPPAPDPAGLDREEILDELAAYLRPPGQGIHTVSTGAAELRAKTRDYLGADWDPDQPWRDRIADGLEHRAAGAVALLAIPSDTGAGIVRGAARGPEAIRAGLGQAPVLDLGDVLSIPHFLDEAMLSADQRRRSQDALWPELDEDRRRERCVSPLGMAERVRRLLAELAPDLRVLALGGDHSVTWPVIWPLLDEPAEVRDDLGIVHFDAHTDLLPERLGVTHCFATWAHHANVALGGGQRMIQIGIRASGRDRGHWERTEGVRQIWAEEARSRPAGELAAEIVAHLRGRGVRRVYLSNDIDGTDAHWAAACGTPEPGGLEPEAVCAIIAAVGDAFEIIGADLVELAPGLSLDAEAAQRSVQTAVRYVRATLTAMARTPAEKELE